jgi:hypothetical protein
MQNFWNLQGKNEWFGPFVSKKTKRCYFLRSSKSEQEKRQLSFQKLSKIIFLKTQLLDSLGQNDWIGPFILKKNKPWYFSSNLRIEMRNTRIFVTKIVGICVSKCRTFGISSAKMNDLDHSFLKKLNGAIFCEVPNQNKKNANFHFKNCQK